MQWVVRIQIKSFIFLFYSFCHKPVGRKRKRASVSDAMLKELGNRCPNLWLLHLDDCNTDNISVESLPRSLCSLAVTQSSWQPRWLKDKHQFLANLEYLDLGGSVRVDKFDLQDIAQLSNLSGLKLNGCYRVKGPDIEIVVKGLPSLTSLDVSNTYIDQEALHHIARHAKNLEELHVAFCTSVCDSSLITVTLGLCNLKKINLSGCVALTMEGLKSLWSLKNLEVLILEQKPNLSSKELDYLKNGFINKIDFIT